MSNKIQKINKLKKIKYFIQINFSPNFEYIDKAGKIINLFKSKENSFNPDIKYIAPRGLIIGSPLPDNISVVRITPDSFWCKFDKPVDFDASVKTFLRKFEKVSSVIDTSKIERVGWRINFLMEFQNEKFDLIEKNNIIGDLLDASFYKKIKNININTKITKLIDNKEENKKALLIDMDFYKDKDISLETFDDIKTLIKSQDFLNFVNDILK